MPAIGATIEVRKKNSTIANDARDWIAFILLLVKTALRRFRLLKSHQLTCLFADYRGFNAFIFDPILNESCGIALKIDNRLP